jgi:hypothetical protein
VVSELIQILEKKHAFLSVMLESIEKAIENMEDKKTPEEIYNTLVTFFGEFPTRAILQEVADERNLGIKVKDRKSAIEGIKLLTD